MALKYSMVLQAVDRLTGPLRKMRGAFSAWRGDVRKVTSDINSGARSVEFYRTRAERLRRVALGRAFQMAAIGARALSRRLAELPGRLRLVERAGRAAKGALGWMGGKALGLAKWAAAGTGALASFSIFDMFRKGGQFEQYQVMLEGIEGSAAAARKSARWVQKFAETTPYELDQVMEAFVALKAYGIDPMNGSLLALGDGASGMSKDLMQAVEALADAMTGEFERLKEFGIRASKQGDKVTFTYRKNGKDLRREAKMTGSEIEKALTGIFSERFGGGMVRQSRTLFGIWSNIKDLWSKFMLMVADAGIFDTVKRKLDEWRGRLDAMAKDGRMQAWAEKLSGWLEKAFNWATDFIEKTDWKKVAGDIEAIAGAAWRVAKGIASMVNGVARWDARRQARMYENTEQGWFSSGKAKADARANRRALEQEWGPLTKSGEADAKRGSRKLSLAPPRAPQLRKQAANDVQVGGRMVVEVKAAPGTSARVSSVQSRNRAVPVQANVGRTMAGAA